MTAPQEFDKTVGMVLKELRLAGFRVHRFDLGDGYTYLKAEIRNAQNTHHLMIFLSGGQIILQAWDPRAINEWTDCSYSNMEKAAVAISDWAREYA